MERENKLNYLPASGGLYALFDKCLQRTGVADSLQCCDKLTIEATDDGIDLHKQNSTKYGYSSNERTLSEHVSKLCVFDWV